MSKSYGNTIPLFGDEKAIKKPVMSIKTDSTPIEEPKVIEGTVLGQLMQAVNADEYKSFVTYAATPGIGYGDLKKKLLSEIQNRFQPFQAKYQHYQDHPDEVEKILSEGANRARELARPILEKARRATGLAQ
jgi:tryptophanyl-tRNA synthetase